MRQLTYAIIACGFLLSTVDAQFVYLSVGGGYSTLNPPENYTFTYLNDRMSWPSTFEGMVGQKADIGFNITSSLEFRLRDAPVSVAAGVSYTQFYGKCDFVKASMPPWSSAMYTIGELTTRSNILTLKTGAQWHIICARIEPYVGLDLLYNIIGDTKLSINNSSGGAKAIVEGNTRMGLSVGGGARIALSPSIGAVIGANYSLINLITPDDQEDMKRAFSLTVSLLCRLL